MTLVFFLVGFCVSGRKSFKKKTKQKTNEEATQNESAKKKKRNGSFFCQIVFLFRFFCRKENWVLPSFPSVNLGSSGVTGFYGGELGFIEFYWV